MRQNGFAPTLAILLIAVVAVGGYFIYTNYSNNRTRTPASLPSPSPAENISNWKTLMFNNLSFKIPANYNSGYLGGSSAVFAIDPQPIPQNSPYGDFTPAFTLEIIKNKTLSQAKKDFLKQDGYTNKESTSVIIDNHSGLKTKEVLSPGQDVVNHNQWDLYISVGQDLYHFSSFDLHISSVEQQKYFDQIVSTFKFTDQNQTANTSNWKTYTNTKHNFSLKHPENWQPGWGTIGNGPSDNDMRESSSLGWIRNDKESPFAIFGFRLVEPCSSTLENCFKKFQDFESQYEVQDLLVLNTSSFLGMDALIASYNSKRYGAPDLAVNRTFFIRNGNLWFIDRQIDNSITPVVKSEIDKEIDQILSTFKFTNN